MWLLNSFTFNLEYSAYTNQKYAILSHRWGDDEVLFQDLWKNPSFLAEKPPTMGKEKILGCCAQARKDGYSLIWIDSCCIDKTSSAELSEAINSMFKWYKDAAVCYAYLADVDLGLQESSTRLSPKVISKSSWFTRSWTLQELLAPKEIEFFAANWKPIGSKAYLSYEIARITAIDIDALQGASLNDYSVAQRMSWAHSREATRPEDIAYSLMGIFDVNMPMLYGEGRRAFRRLQEEILRISDDETIFAWDTTEEPAQGVELGALAAHPSYFKTCRGMRSVPNTNVESHVLTNRGLSTSFNLVPRSKDVFIALLDCVHTQEAMADLLVGFYLHRVTENVFERTRSTSGDYRWIGPRHDLDLSNMLKPRFYIRPSNGNRPTFTEGDTTNCIVLDIDSADIDERFETNLVKHIGTWHPNEHLLKMPLRHTGSALSITIPRVNIILEIGFDDESSPCCLIVNTKSEFYMTHAFPDSTKYQKLGWTFSPLGDHPVSNVLGYATGYWAFKGSSQGLMAVAHDPLFQLSLIVRPKKGKIHTWQLKILKFEVRVLTPPRQ